MPPSPIAGSIARAASPVPVEISSTVLPGPIAAAAITWGTNSRDQWPVKRSYAATSTTLPAAACSPGANCGMAPPRQLIAGEKAGGLRSGGLTLPHPGDRRRHSARIAPRPPPRVHLRDERANNPIELVGIFDVDRVATVRHH